MLRHERMTVATALAEMTHHSAPRKPMMARAREEECEMNNAMGETAQAVPSSPGWPKQRSCTTPQGVRGLPGPGTRGARSTTRYDDRGPSSPDGPLPAVRGSARPLPAGSVWHEPRAHIRRRSISAPWSSSQTSFRWCRSCDAPGLLVEDVVVDLLA